MQPVQHLVGNQMCSNPTSSSCIKLSWDSDIYMVCFTFCSIVPKADQGDEHVPALGSGEGIWEALRTG